MKTTPLIAALLLFCTAHLTTNAQNYSRKTNLPAIYIETDNRAPIVSKTDYINSTLYMVDEFDNVTRYDSVDIRGRGNSTWNMPKKPYKIKFQTKQKFLGKGFANAKKWTLLANAGDKTMIRNAITMSLGQFVGMAFNPAVKFVDLTLNGTYVGTYQISDQIDVRAHRVNITEQEVPLGNDDNITGGYLLETDGFRDGNYFESSTYKAPVRIHYPEEEDIQPRQNTYIRQFINNTFEHALSSTKFTDPTTGYRAYVDTTSLINWYLCTEISANIDGFYSTYFYKDQNDQRLYWGPLWDYDIAYNNDYRVSTEKGLSSSVNALMIDIAYSGSKKWVERMWQDPWFQKAVYHRYLQLLDQGMVSYLHQQVDSLQQLLSQSQWLNYQKWGINRRVYHETVIYSSYNQYIQDLKQFITEHCDFLAQAFYQRLPETPVTPQPDDNNHDDTSISSPAEPEDYALAYSRQNHTLRFASETPDMLQFTATIHDMKGHQVAQFHASATYSTMQLPAGIYIVTWRVGGKVRSAKFVQ